MGINEVLEQLNKYDIEGSFSFGDYYIKSYFDVFAGNYIQTTHCVSDDNPKDEDDKIIKITLNDTSYQYEHEQQREFKFDKDTQFNMTIYCYDEDDFYTVYKNESHSINELDEEFTNEKIDKIEINNYYVTLQYIASGNLLILRKN